MRFVGAGGSVALCRMGARCGGYMVGARGLLVVAIRNHDIYLTLGGERGG